MVRSGGNMAPDGNADVEMLIQALRRGNPTERLDAAERLSLLGQEAAVAVPVLIEALRDESAEVRSEVATALGMIGVKAFTAIPALIQVFKEDKERAVRIDAVWALDFIAHDIGLGSYNAQAVPLLIKALQDESSDMRGAAAATLGDLVLSKPLEVREVIDALERVALNEHEDNGVRAVAFEAIEKLESG